MIARRALAATSLLGLLAGAAPAAETDPLRLPGPGGSPDLDGLLKRLAPAEPVPEGSVRIVGWIEQGAAHDELVLTLEPEGAAKLVADPGITVQLRDNPGIDWLGRGPVEITDPSRSYFETAPEIRVPFRVAGKGSVSGATPAAVTERPVGAADPGVASEVAVTVEYAWCLVDRQCLFGEATVSLPPPGEG